MFEPLIIRVENESRPLWLRALRQGELVCRCVEPEIVLDSPELHECVSVHDGRGRLAQVCLEGASVSVRLAPVRVLVSTLAHEGLDRALPFRDLSRRMAELDFDQERVGLIDFEFWHLLPTAALLFRDTPPERLTHSYLRRIEGALDVVSTSSGSTEMLELAASTWAEHWLSDDADPPTLEALGAEVLPRLRERLGAARYGAALSAGAAKVRASRDPWTIAVMNVGTDVERFRDNTRRIAVELEGRGTRWGHHAYREVTHLDTAYELGEWLSDDLVLASLWDPITQLAFVHFESPRALQVHGVRALVRKLVAVGLTGAAPEVAPDHLAKLTHAAAWVIDSTRTR